MVSLEELRDQLRDALAVLKVVMADPVPAEEVFFVRDIEGYAHVAGPCITPGRFPLGARWERIVSINLPTLAGLCPCVHRTPAVFTGDVNHIEYVVNSHPKHLLWTGSGGHVSLFSTFPAVFEVWERARRLYCRLVVADGAHVDLRAARLGVSVSQLSPVGVCTLQCKHPAELEVFPNGVPSTVPWVALPEDIAAEFWFSPDKYALVGVEGWPVERVEVVSTLIRDAGSTAEALAAFKLAEQIVP